MSPPAPPNESTLPTGCLYDAGGGRLLWVPGELPVQITPGVLGLTVAEWLGVCQGETRPSGQGGEPAERDAAANA